MSLVHLPRRNAAPRRGALFEALLRKAIHNSLDPLFNRRRAEIQQQTYGEISEPQVGPYLLAVNRRKRLHGLYFHQYEILNDEICTVRALNAHAAVDQGHGPLSVDV